MAHKQLVCFLLQIIATVSIQRLSSLELALLRESQIFDLAVVQAQAQTFFL